MLVIFLMSAEVADTSSARSDEIVRTIQSIGMSAPEDMLTYLVRKTAHISAYFVLGILLFNLLREYKLSKKRLILASIAIAMLYAVTDELHQLFVPGRSGEIGDVLIDSTAAIIGVLLSAWVTQSRRLRGWLTLLNIRRALAIVAAALYLLAVASLAIVRFVPLKYLLPVVLLSGLGMALLLRAQLRSKVTAAKSVGLIALSLLIAVVSTGALTTAMSLASFMGGVQQSEYSTRTYSVIAKKDRNVNLQGAKTAALLGNDANLSEVKAGLRQKTAAAPVQHDNLASIVAAVDAGAADTAVLSTAHMGVVQDNNYDFYTSVEVLATFTIRVKNSANSQVDVTKPFVAYISGIDTYGAISTESRSDVNMLAVVNPQTNKVLLVNTPRDYYVQLHGTTGAKDKLTHAGLYGIDMSRQTLEDLYGTTIDTYVRVNFSSLVEIIDVLGGVEVYSDYDFKTFHTGANYVNGAQALVFARERYSFSDGDRQRGKNQQRVIEAVIAKMNNPSNILNYQSILRATQSAVQTNLGQDSLAKLANRQLDSLKKWSVESISVDGTGATAATYSMGTQQLYVMVPDQQTVDTAKQKIADTIRSM